MHVRAEGCPKEVLSTQLWTASAEQRTADTYNMQVLLSLLAQVPVIFVL